MYKITCTTTDEVYYARTYSEALVIVNIAHSRNKRQCPCFKGKYRILKKY